MPDPSSHPASSDHPDDSQSHRKPRLMIIDDALIARMRIRDVAVSCGWDVVAELADGQLAADAYGEHQPDLVTLDIVMPQIDGLETLRTILAVHPRAKVVMVSAVSGKDKLADAVQLGVIDFLVKPFDPDELASVFNKTAEQIRL